MQTELLGTLLIALLLAAPLLIERYLRALPEAPACPACHSIARQVSLFGILALLIPDVARTFVAECGRCGWRGRMRWRWAPDPAQENRFR